MCSLAPRLTTTALESRVHVHSLTEVSEISGPPGEFRVTLRHKPRYVTEACVGCGECEPVCPVSYDNDFDFGVAQRRAINRPFANAVPATFHVERKGWSPCKTACAVHTSAQGYVALVAAGRFAEAYRVAAEPNPFPSVCGRICTHLCETACARGKVDKPVAIAALKRFVADEVGPTLAGSARARSSTREGGCGRRRAGRPDRRPRPRRAGLRHDRVRGPAGRRRHAAHRHPRLPPARRRPFSARSIRSSPWGSSCGSASAPAPTSPSTACSATATSAVFLATGLQRSAAVEIPGAELRGRAARRRAPARAQPRAARRRSARRSSWSAAATSPSTPPAAPSACRSPPDASPM